MRHRGLQVAPEEPHPAAVPERVETGRGDGRAGDVHGGGPRAPQGGGDRDDTGPGAQVERPHAAPELLAPQVREQQRRVPLGRVHPGEPVDARRVRRRVPERDREALVGGRGHLGHSGPLPSGAGRRGPEHAARRCGRLLGNPRRDPHGPAPQRPWSRSDCSGGCQESRFASAAGAATRRGLPPPGHPSGTPPERAEEQGRHHDSDHDQQERGGAFGGQDGGAVRRRGRGEIHDRPSCRRRGSSFGTAATLAEKIHSLTVGAPSPPVLRVRAGPGGVPSPPSAGTAPGARRRSGRGPAR